MYKIEVYTPDNTEFDYAGNATLIGEASLNAQLNGTWELSLTINNDEEGAWKLLEEESVVRVFTFLNKYQLFRVYDVQPSDTITYANARPIAMDAGDEIFLIGENSDGTPQSHLDVIFNDSKYTGTTDIIGSGEATYDMVNALGAISGEDGFISIFGGEIIYDDYHIYIYEQVGDNLGLTVELGRNMTGIKVTKNTDSMVTRIIPVAYNGWVLPEQYVESPFVNDYAKFYTTTLDCSDLKLLADCSESDEEYYETKDELYVAMRERAAEQFDGIIDVPVFTYEVSFIDLANTDGYEDVQGLITAHLGDTVLVRNVDLELYLESRVIELTWNCVYGETESVVLGEYDPTIIDSSIKTSGSVGNMESVFDSHGSVMASQITGVLDLLTTSLRYQKNASQTLDIRAMLLEDVNPLSELFGAISIGTQGVQISKERNETDTDWKWGTAINFEAINADYILTGVLSDRKGNFILDLDNGTFYSSAFSEYTTTEDLNQDLASVYLSISNLQSQVDGEINSWFYAYSPTTSNYPASEWLTDTEKNRHIGDTFTNITEFVNDTSTPDAGKSWRYVVSGTTYSWLQIADSDAVKALQDAAKAQGTADGKTTTYSSQPTTYSENDMWVLADDWNGYEAGTILMSNATSSSFVSAHWSDKLSYATESTVTAAISVAEKAILLSVSDNYATKTQVSGLVASTVVEYYLSTSSTTVTGGSWSSGTPTWTEGKYIWSRSHTTYEDSTSVYSDPVNIQGAAGTNGTDGTDGVDGTNGIDGTTIASIKAQYYLSTSKTALVDGEWLYTDPSWVADSYIWTRSEITYENPDSIAYTEPYCDSSWEAVTEATNRIETKLELSLSGIYASVGNPDVTNEDIFTTSGATTGYYMSASGAIVSNSNWNVTDYIEVVPNVTYTVNNYSNLGNNASTGFYDDGYNLIYAIANGNSNSVANGTVENDARRTLVAPVNAKYIRVSYYTTDTTMTLKATSNISSLLSLEEGVISLTGDRLYIDMTNFKLSTDGTMECENGIFRGSVDTTLDVNVGNNINMNTVDTGPKYINFSSSAYILLNSGAGYMAVRTPSYIYLQAGYTSSSDILSQIVCYGGTSAINLGADAVYIGGAQIASRTGTANSVTKFYDGTMIITYSVTVDLAAGSTSSTTITWGTAFTYYPRISLTLYAADPSRAVGSITSISTTAVTVQAYSPSYTGTTIFHVQAIGRWN